MLSEAKLASSLLRNVLRNLYIGYLKNRKSKTFNCRLILGEVDELISEKTKIIVDVLKNKKVVKSYKQENVYIDGDQMVYLNCIVLSNNFIEYLQSISLLPQFYITLEKGDTIVLNDRYRMRKPHFDGDNEIFFKCVFENPNKRLRMEDFTDYLRKQSRNKELKFNKKFKYCKRDLQFTGELGKIFFRTSNLGVEFRNPVFKSDIESLKINKSKLLRQIKDLTTINLEVRKGEKKG